MDLRNDLNLKERASIIYSLTYSSANILKTYYVLRNTLDTKNNHEERTKKKIHGPMDLLKIK